MGQVTYARLVEGVLLEAKESSVVSLAGLQGGGAGLGQQVGGSAHEGCGGGGSGRGGQAAPQGESLKIALSLLLLLKHLVNDHLLLLGTDTDNKHTHTHMDCKISLHLYTVSY